jgi:hypothetical protein
LATLQEIAVSRIHGRKSCRRHTRGRALDVDWFERRCLLAVETLIGSAWEEVWSGRTSDSGVGSEIDHAITADLNGDGYRDVLVHDLGGGPNHLFLGRDVGTLARPITYVFSRSLYLDRVLLGDIAEGGDLDVQLEGSDSPYVGPGRSTRRSVILNQANTFWPIGDSNRDGQFNSADLVMTFQAGEYEDTLAGNSKWTEGDWNGDGDFTTGDLVMAFQAGSYVAATGPLKSAVRADFADLAEIAASIAAEQHPRRGTPVGADTAHCGAA